ncbi:hypothetical protein GCM10010156_18240 [Planobispora rosea]|uniref:HNH domain-containing protein n=1 Tax=Planobispora rosea TaxID=35762 RepID=A0A8J3WDN8_PLARO|nr:hypothetical protein GCM10010156_18240 [Planobispora rosea]GIH84076.1 hypothetical protein Pro02_24840 [Planobispora rosea]
MATKYKYTPEMLAEAAADSHSIADVLRRLGITIAGGNHAHISRQLKRFKIDTSHFRRVPSNKGKPSPRRRRPAQILVVLPEGSPRPSPARLRRALIESGMPYHCAGCKIEGVWQGQPLTLHIDHVSGDWLDNRIKNLRFLCPNCHSQTENFAGKKRGCSPAAEATSLGGVKRGFESRQPHEREINRAVTLRSVTTSVTISPQDDFFLRDYIFRNNSASRSAVIGEALGLLREKAMRDDYAASGGEAGAEPWSAVPGAGSGGPT